MLKALITIIVVLIVVHRGIIILDYFFGVPNSLFRIESYLSYVLSVFFIGLLIMQKDVEIAPLYIAFSIYWIIQAIIDFIDYKYGEAQEEAEREEQEKKEEQEEKYN